MHRTGRNDLPYVPVKYRANAEAILRELRERPPELFVRRGERRVLDLFHAMARRVPAYKDVLKRHRIDPAKVRTMADFAALPLLDKDNYLRSYPLADLCWDGEFARHQWDISSTSGSTGEPFYFPREASQNWQYAVTAELYLRNNFQIHRRSTLYVNCFALGVWIGGIFTYEALKIVAERGGYALTVINPGLNKAEILKAVRALGPHFDQVIIGAYPPFAKDVIDDGIAAGMNWKDYHVRMVFSAEGFSEEFRDYIAAKTGMKDIYADTLNHYGTVDQGTIAHETPLSVLVRRLAVKKKARFDAVFGNGVTRLPTLAQYDPELFFFEEVNGGIVCSAWSGLPLVRYDLKDHGGVIGYGEMFQRLESADVDLKKEIRAHGLAKSVWHLPFVYVYERKDLSIILSGANIYPESIRKVLVRPAFNGVLTGKFAMAAIANKKQDQQFEVNVELKSGRAAVPPSLARALTDAIVEQLLKDNSEYRIIYEQKRKGAHPAVRFWPYEHPDYFRVGGKQKWVMKKQ